MRLSRQFSFLNGPNKVIFVRMYESTFSGTAIPLLFTCRILCFFVLYYTHKNTHKQKLTNKTKIN